MTCTFSAWTIRENESTTEPDASSGAAAEVEWDAVMTIAYQLNQVRGIFRAALPTAVVGAKQSAQLAGRYSWHRGGRGRPGDYNY